MNAFLHHFYLLCCIVVVVFLVIYYAHAPFLSDFTRIPKEEVIGALIENTILWVKITLIDVIINYLVKR